VFHGVPYKPLSVCSARLYSDEATKTRMHSLDYREHGTGTLQKVVYPQASSSAHTIQRFEPCPHRVHVLRWARNIGMSSARKVYAQLCVATACVHSANRATNGAFGVLAHWSCAAHVRSVVLGMVHVVCPLRTLWYLHGACTGCIV
jgi:hypothetical protein